MDKERVQERKYRDRVRESEKKGLDRIFASLLDRQTDFKHIIQLVQDVEIIKKVLFQERHLVLAPLVTLEAEKRWVRKKTFMDEAYKKEQDEEWSDDNDEGQAGRGGGEGPGPDGLLSVPLPGKIDHPSSGQDQSSTVQRDSHFKRTVPSMLDGSFCDGNDTNLMSKTERVSVMERTSDIYSPDDGPILNNTSHCGLLQDEIEKPIHI
jgi:hypothetical protein